jgi:hypothetical protein
MRPTALRLLRPPRLRLPAKAPVAGKIIGLGVDAERDANGGAKCCPMAFAVVAYPGQRIP